MKTLQEVEEEIDLHNRLRIAAKALEWSQSAIPEEGVEWLIDRFRADLERNKAEVLLSIRRSLTSKLH